MVGSLQQDRSAIGPAIQLIELQYAIRPVWRKSLGTTDTVLCYRQTRGGLSSCFKHWLDAMFVAEVSFRVFITNNPG
jgi:hypothetical protein